MLKIISTGILSIVLTFLGYVYLLDINFVEVGGNSQVNYYPYIRFSLALILAFLLVLILKNRKKTYDLLHLLWMIPILYFFINHFFGFYNTKKLDYILGKTIDQYNIKQYKKRDWLVNEITVKEESKIDTISVSESPSWENKSDQLKSRNESKIVKSWITGYYYVSVNK